MDGQEGGYHVGRRGGLGGFFYPGRVHQAHGGSDLGVWLDGWWRFSAEGGLREAVSCDWADCKGHLEGEGD